MATIQDINSASNYLGSKELGGYIPSAIDLDTKPLMTLAAYAVMENQANYRQRQLDTDQKIAELAELSKYDIANARGKDKEMAIEMFTKLQDEMRNYAMNGVPNDPKEKLVQELEIKQKTAEAITKIKALNGRGLAYQKRLNDINTNYADAKIRDIKKKQLDEEFDSTDWRTPLSSEEKFTAVLPTIGDAQYTTTTTSTKLGNQILQQEVTLFNPAVNMNNSISEGLGFSETMTLPPNATPAQVRQFELQQASGGQVKTLNDAANFLNQALANPKYKNPDGTLNAELVAQDNKIAGAILKGRDRYNQYATELKEDIKRGVYKTKMGAEIALDNVISDQDVFLIDKNRELKVEDLIFIEKFLKAAPDKEEEKIIQTNEQLSRDDNARAWFTAKANARPTASSGGGSAPAGSDQTALIFGEHVNRLKNGFAKRDGKNFVVSYEATDPTTRTALGLTQGQFVTYRPDGTAMVGTDKDGKGGVPMTIEQQKLNFVVAVKGGSKDEAQLDAKFIEEQENGFKGIFNTTSASQIWNGWGKPQVVETETTTTTTTPTTTTTTNKTELRNKYNY